MSIIYHSDAKTFSLHTDNSTYQLRIDEFGILQHVYYGEKIIGDAGYMIRYVSRGIGASISDAGNWQGYSLDNIPLEYPTIGVGDFRSPALRVQNADSSECVDLRYVSHTIFNGKYALHGLPAVTAQAQEAQTLSVILQDRISGLQVELLYGVLPACDVITRAARIMNKGENALTLEKVSSACLDFIFGEYDVISFHGTHCLERMYQRKELSAGCYSIGSRRGTSSHQYNPAVIIAEKDCTETSGNCYGSAFVYSGGFLCEIEKCQFGETRVLMGIQPEGFHYSLNPGEQFVVPETILAYSGNGLEKLSHCFHQVMRKHLIRGKYANSARPVLLNSWEANYFNISGERIVKLAAEAAELGLDMVVMDDGWFGHRNNDSSSLGDWTANEKKLGCSLAELAACVNKAGVRFGIWIEPEMVSEDSDLYRSHSDWALQFPNRGPVRSRNQLVLDFSREEVRNEIFRQICCLLDTCNIEYIKWDYNRSINDFWSQMRPSGKVMYDYILGLYDFLEKFINRYPNVLLETCCSGGGRFDAGMLYYSPQIWCSDNTDALERIKIQHGTSYFYPVSTMGAHVSASPNHQTRRSSSLNTRTVVAMAGTFGYELNPAEMTAEEKECARQQIALYKEHQALIHDGDYYRLTIPHESNLAAWAFVSRDRKEVLLNMVVQEALGCGILNYVRLRGLNPNTIYKDMSTGIRYSGSVLMYAGFPFMGDDAYQVYFREC